MKDEPKSPQLVAVNKSGYPLQMAIAHGVKACNSEHGWRVLYEEHSWRHRLGNDGFIDIVLEHEATQVVLVIECKRFLGDKEWIFLANDGDAHPRRYTRGFRVDRQDGVIKGHGPRWTDEAAHPAAPQAMFCIPRGDDRNTTAETLGAELVLATEALESEERAYMDRRGDNSTRIYFAAIVTTVQLSVCAVDPKSISLADGTIPAGAQFAAADSVRFTKQLSTEPTPGTPYGSHSREAASLARSKDRTVFIISADKLDAFLRKFRVDERQE
jgi:hypothetical protein